MNYLIAKIRGKNKGYFKVISNKEIFTLPKDMGNAKVYTPQYKLEEDEWFAIKDFSTKEFSIDFLTKKFISTEYNQIAVADYRNIIYLCSYQTGVYYLQKLSASQIIQKKWFPISKAPKLVENEPIIVIDNYADAIYLKETDTLYFKSLEAITTIFRGIEVLYREATEKETEDFLKSDFIKLEKEYNAENVKKANRKRIAMAMDTISKFTAPEKKTIFKYIQVYCKKLKFDKKAANFTIESEEDLKQLLYGIEQRYYTTPLGGEHRLANSISVIADT